MQGQRAALLQEQRQKLSPQLLQRMQILALPLQDLELRIKAEVEANPALEIVEEHQFESIDTISDGKDLAELNGYADRGSNSMDLGAYERFEYDGYNDEAAEERYRFMQNALTRPESLQDHLLWQLRLNPLPEEFFQIGEIIIRNLSEQGFHLEDPKAIIPEDQWQAMDKVLKIVQGLEPAGCATANFKESLKVQALQFAFTPEYVVEIIDNYFELLEKGKIKEIAKAVGQKEAVIDEAIVFIKQLNPFPGLQYGDGQSQYVIPDVHITRKDDEFIITINEDHIPVLGINPFFDEMLRKKTKDEIETTRYVQNNIRNARGFIQNIRMRNETLAKVVRTIVEFQKEFFLSGPKSIVPLTLKNIAEEIGHHEATVSRLTNGKYAQTDWGLFELKYFFSGTIAGTNGQQFSREGVKHILKEVLAEHAGTSLSDQKLCELLAAKGVKIARRTIAKYRSELDIASSYGR